MPHPVVPQGPLVCSDCGLPWKDHHDGTTQDERAEHEAPWSECVRLLKMQADRLKVELQRRSESAR